MTGGPASTLDRGALTRRALDRFSAARYEEALGFFDALLALAPGDAWTLAHRAETRLRLGDPISALADFDDALAMRPDYPWAHAHRGVCLRKSGRYSEALAAFNHALALRSDNAWALVHRANMHMALGQFQRALDDVDRALILNPEALPHPAGERGLILNALRRFQESAACCRDALARDPADFVAAYSLAVARTRLKGVAAERGHTSALRDRLAAADPRARDEALVYRRAGLTALLGEIQPALALLARVVPASEEFREVARHDPAWDEFRGESRFQRLWDAA